MASAATMPELQENPSARLVNGTCDTAPPFDLLGQVDSRFIRKRRPAGHRHRGLSDDEAGRCTLRVVLRHQRCGNMVWSAATSEWCHQDAVWRIDDPKSQRCEKSRHGSIRRCIRSRGSTCSAAYCSGGRSTHSHVARSQTGCPSAVTGIKWNPARGCWCTRPGGSPATMRTGAAQNSTTGQNG
jgi:hypothetical protein